jgi:hypothetical protein
MVLETGECCGPAVVPGCQSCGATVVFSTIEHYPWTDAVGALLQRVEDRCALDLALCQRAGLWARTVVNGDPLQCVHCHSPSSFKTTPL